VVVRESRFSAGCLACGEIVVLRHEVQEYLRVQRGSSFRCRPCPLHSAGERKGSGLEGIIVDTKRGNGRKQRTISGTLCAQRG